MKAIPNETVKKILGALADAEGKVTGIIVQSDKSSVTVSIANSANIAVDVEKGLKFKNGDNLTIDVASLELTVSTGVGTSAPKSPSKPTGQGCAAPIRHLN